ncbi:MAG TPA: uroporphyrinogen decarboxylase family protein [Armatimonadota bacterium]|nr:uroporphyrinogen decarboxylase family protein [Armatimonadota bacterium]
MSSFPLSSRERVLFALRRQPVDYLPCAPNFNPLTEVQRRGYRWVFPWGPSQREEMAYLKHELGLDPVVTLPLGGYYPDPRVCARVWTDGDIIHKAYDTPAGVLRAAVRDDGRWPFGLDIPFHHDFLGHYVEPWITSEQDVACLAYLYLPPRTEDQLAAIRYNVTATKRIAEELGLATRAWLGMGLTHAQQLWTPEPLCYAVADTPELVHAFLDIEHRLSMAWIEVAVAAGADIILRNGFYESCDLYSPAMLEAFLGARLRAEFALARQGGAAACYLVHTGITPMLDYLAALEFDCLTYPDIAFRGNDLHAMQAKLGDRKSFWAGPSNTFHMWADDPATVRQAVRDTAAAFGKTGLLLAACPSVHPITPWENFLAMVEEWRAVR